MKKKANRREALNSYHVHTKGGLERLLVDVAKAYVAIYPRKARWIRAQIKKLGEVSTSGYRARGHDVEVTVRVPTELWLFVQSLVPEFGKDSKDVEVLQRVWKDFAVGKDRRRRTRIIGGTNEQESESKEPADPEVECVHCGKTLRWSEAIGSGRPFCSTVCLHAAAD